MLLLPGSSGVVVVCTVMGPGGLAGMVCVTPIGLPLAKNDTVPVGATPPVKVGVTVAEIVTEEFNPDGLGTTLTPTVGVTLLTVWSRVAELLAAKLVPFRAFRLGTYVALTL